FFVLPGQGAFGPYELESWSINGQMYSTTFMTIPELVDSMNVWDTMSTWVFDAQSLIVSGGNTENNFGQMHISQTNTGAIAIIEVNANLDPKATELYLEVGVHEVIFTNDNTGCTDTVVVTVTCIHSDILTDTIYVNTTDTMCIPTDELLGEVVSYENQCEDSSGEFVIFNQIDGSWCVQYEGMEIGTDSACVVLCDDTGLCDTTYLFVTVVEQGGGGLDSLPDAVHDVDTMAFNTSSTIDLLNNDSINGVFDTLYILNPPTHGTIVLHPDGTVTYTPNEDYCDTAIPDEFSYVLCNTVGCDTTTVSLYVLCDKLIIYTGFSPNGDRVNDFFHIEGVENYPDNELNIFNRWGNEVYYAEGYLNNWDGTWNGKDLPDGTYFYVFQYKNGDGTLLEESGYVQIHR
ncbi:MAG TPA: gliding motility-associated C-terminal domain-containing protein, partial [Phaeodactylibacter sp.]|nr:gliding motility-associated C-terminal domain-containing protein [Phaeodactylibacter sp.]